MFDSYWEMRCAISYGIARVAHKTCQAPLSFHYSFERQEDFVSCGCYTWPEKQLERMSAESLKERFVVTSLVEPDSVALVWKVTHGKRHTALVPTREAGKYELFRT